MQLGTPGLFSSSDSRRAVMSRFLVFAGGMAVPMARDLEKEDFSTGGLFVDHAPTIADKLLYQPLFSLSSIFFLAFQFVRSVFASTSTYRCFFRVCLYRSCSIRPTRFCHLVYTFCVNFSVCTVSVNQDR